MVGAPKFYGNLSGYENLKLMAKLIDGTSYKDIDKSLELLGLKDRGKEKFASYSFWGWNKDLAWLINFLICNISQAHTDEISDWVADSPKKGLIYKNNK